MKPLKSPPSPFHSIKDILSRLDLDQDKYISHEFQKYGYDLAESLNDLKNKSLYIKLAKVTPRAWLEQARNFVKDAYNVKNPARLFMWKLAQIRKEKTQNSKSEIDKEDK